MKVAVVGADGQLGSDVVEVFNKQFATVIPLCHTDGSVESRSRLLYGVLERYGPDVIVNTAAYHQLDQCEKYPSMAFAVNYEGAGNVAEIAESIGAVLVHISTDYVFDGKDHLYTETALPNPLNVYGVSKLAGEYAVRNKCRKYFVLRTTALYGKHPCRGKGGLSFVGTILKKAANGEKIRIIKDQYTTPTSTMELASHIAALVQTDYYGLYHATAEGYCSWFEFAKEILRLSKIDADLEPIEATESSVRRPACPILMNMNLNKVGLNNFRHWTEGLEEFLRK